MGDVSPKLKIVYLMKILNEKTDETHSVTMADILKELSNYGITAERKSIYSDIELLKQYGLEIEGEQRERTYYYRLVNRDFELAELKLLVDAVSSARFVTEKKSNALIKKIEGLASEYEARKLQRQVFVAERVKSENEQILYNIDAIHRAIAENSQIKFKYFNWNSKKEMELRRDGQFYEMSPWALTLQDEYYYLVCFDKETESIKYFRVDKMLKIDLTDTPREGKEQFDKFDIALYAKKRFGMFDGEEKNVSLLCHNSYAGVIIDRFGKEVAMRPFDDEHFVANVNVALTRQFLAWVFSMSDFIKILSPSEAVEEIKVMAEKLLKQY